MVIKGQEVVILSVTKNDFEQMKEKVENLDYSSTWIYLNDENDFHRFSVELQERLKDIHSILELIVKSKID